MKAKFLSLSFSQVKEIAFPSIVFLISLFSIGKFLYPKASQTFVFHQRLKQNETQVLKLEKKAAFLKEQKEQNIAGLYEKIDQVFPSEKDVAKLLISLEGLKKDSGLKIEEMDLSPGLLATEEAKLSKSSKKEFNFRLSLRGSYDKLSDFLRKLEKTAPLTSVEKAQLRFTRGKEDVGVNLSFKAYYLPSKANFRTPLDKPLPELTPSLKNTLERILDFKIFVQVPFLPEDQVGKENPFSF